MKTFFLLALSWCLILSAEAQIINKDKLKDKLNREKDKAKDKAKDKVEDTKRDAKRKGKDAVNDAMDKTLDKMRGEYDTTSFSYAIALSDNAGSYEDGERGKRLMQLAIAGTDALNVTNDKNRDYNQAAKNYNSIGSMFFASNKYKNAERFFTLAQNQFEKNSSTNTPSYAQTLANKGLLYETVGRYGEAEKHTLQSLEIRKSVLGESSNAYATSLNNLAMLYRDMGKYSDAEGLLTQALGAIEKLFTQNSIQYAIILNNQAMLYQSLGRTEQAITNLKKVLEITAPLLKEKSTTFQRFQANLALLYQEQKNYTEAEKIYLDAIDSREKFLKIKQHPDVAHLKVLLASLYMDMGKTTEVEKLLIEAKEAYEGKLGKENPAYATALSHLGNFYRTQGNLAQAEPVLRECLNIREVALSNQHPLYTKAQEDMALLYWAQKNYDKAGELFTKVIQQSNNFIQQYFPAMSETEKEKYLNKLRPTYQRFFNFGVASQGSANYLTEMYNAHLATKALLLSSSSKIKQKILGSGNTELIADYKTWVDLKEDLSLIYMLSKAERLEQRINLDSLEGVANQLEKKLSANADFFKQDKNLTYQDIIAQLKQGNEAVVDILTFPRYDGTKFLQEMVYVAFVAGKTDAKPRLVVMNNGNELNEKYYKNYRLSIKSKKADKYSYDQYWKAIDEATAGKTKLYLSLDGVYNQISINTLQKSTGKYVVEERTLVFLTNLKDLTKPKSSSNITNKDITLVANPDYGTEGKIPALPGTKAEADAVGKIAIAKGYKVNKVMGKEAHEGVIKALTQSPHILHIATHGFFIPDVDRVEGGKLFGIDIEKAKQNPMLRSGLMFADAEKALKTDNSSPELRTDNNGILTAYELMTLPLDNTDIAIMSACETGLGDVKAGEGVYGLQRAAQLAGVKNLIMSLWTVSDAATQKLMTLFYQNYTGNNKSEAFNKAMLQLKAEYKEPYFWGAFVLIGE
jgi:CHAT domain-containing protein